MSEIDALDELWWNYLCRVQEKHRQFDKELALKSPKIALERLERELLPHHPIYYRSIWFLVVVNLLAEAGESVDFADQRIAAVLQLVRELSREVEGGKTWRNGLANGVARRSAEGGVARQRTTRERTWVVSQYISLVEEFHGTTEGRTFFLWASGISWTQRRVVTVGGNRSYLPSQSELQSKPGVGLTLFIGSGRYLELLAKAHDILIWAQNSTPASFCSALWAFQADSLFDISKVDMAKAIRHGRHPLLGGGDTSANLSRLLQGAAPPTSEEAQVYESLLAMWESKARAVASEDEWRGHLVRERLFGRAREEAFFTEDA